MYRPHLDLTEVGKDSVKTPTRVYYDQIKRIVNSRRFPEGTYIDMTDGEGVHVIEPYHHVKGMIDCIRECPPPRLCYVFTVKGTEAESSHYVPVDEVARLVIIKTTNNAILVLKSGDRLNTNMNMGDLKKTLIEVAF